MSTPAPSLPTASPVARSWGQRWDDLVQPVAPAERLASVRILVGVFALIYTSIRSVALAQVAHHDPTDFEPAGLVRLLSAPLPPWLVYGAVGLTLLMAIPFLLGWFFRITGPIFALSLVWVLSYRNSFGMIFHTENLLALHVVILALSNSAAAWSLDARRKKTVPEPSRQFGFALQVMGVVAACAYVLAGIAKLKVSGVAWASGDILRNHIAHDNLRKLLLGDGHSPLGAWAVTRSWMFPPLALMTFVFELGAPIALLRGRIAAIWVLVAWSFHVGVLALMWILFPYQLFGIAFACFFRTERFVGRVGSWMGRRLGRSAERSVAHAVV